MATQRLSVEQKAIAIGLYTSRPASFNNYFVAKNTPETQRHLRTMTSSAQGANGRSCPDMVLSSPFRKEGGRAARLGDFAAAVLPLPNTHHSSLIIHHFP
ncbi:MAG: hypothetical protein NTV22_13595 [bacterium]|nr:hypothetical protein [bacterium]